MEPHFRLFLSLTYSIQFVLGWDGGDWPGQALIFIIIKHDFQHERTINVTVGQWVPEEGGHEHRGGMSSVSLSVTSTPGCAFTVSVAVLKQGQLQERQGSTVLGLHRVTSTANLELQPLQGRTRLSRPSGGLGLGARGWSSLGSSLPRWSLSSPLPGRTPLGKGVRPGRTR